MTHEIYKRDVDNRNNNSEKAVIWILDHETENFIFLLPDLSKFSYYHAEFFTYKMKM